MSPDDIDLLRIARMHNDPLELDAPQFKEKTTPMNDLQETIRERLGQVATKARAKLGAFNARHSIVDTEAVRKDALAAREKARENVRKVHAYLRAVYEADPNDEE